MLESNGIKYYTEINPLNKITVKSLQNKYITEYNISFHLFLIEISGITDDVIKKNKRSFTIDCSGENDEIESYTNYDIKFLRSVFLKDKVKDIHNMFNSSYENYYITGPKLGLNNTFTFFISSKTN